MRFDRDRHWRRSLRLQGYDYASLGAYFVTVCAQGREHVFGDVRDGEVLLSRLGEMARQFWNKIPDHFNHVSLDAYVIMPNHVHGIVILDNVHAGMKRVGAQRVGVQYIEPLRDRVEYERRNKFQHIIPNSIGSIIRTYKAAVTRWSRKNALIYQVWQRNYYERVIRTDRELNHIRQYIQDNPQNWDRDPERPVVEGTWW